MTTTEPNFDFADIYISCPDIQVQNPTFGLSFIESPFDFYLDYTWAKKRKDFLVEKIKKRIAIRNRFIVAFAIVFLLSIETMLMVAISPFLSELSSMIYGYAIALSLILAETIIVAKFPTKYYEVKFKRNGKYY